MRSFWWSGFGADVVLCFFFEAEDGIRYATVTGVQTCALPICSIGWTSLARLAQRGHVACYVVMFADHSFYGREVRHYGYYLVELAPKTGGRVWEVGDNPRKAHEATQPLALTLDSQDLIEVFVPDVHANRFHPVKVTSPGYRVSA